MGMLEVADRATRTAGRTHRKDNVNVAGNELRREWSESRGIAASGARHEHHLIWRAKAFGVVPPAQGGHAQRPWLQVPDTKGQFFGTPRACCASPARGQATAAPPTRVINSRRSICPSEHGFVGRPKRSTLRPSCELEMVQPQTPIRPNVAFGSFSTEAAGSDARPTSALL
jgi:hypothetical protein